MDLNFSGIILIITFIHTTAVESTLTQYLFHENCGRTLYPFKVAGELVFTSRDVHALGSRTQYCEVIISPKAVNANFNNRILFYFTQFNIGRRCSNNNLTIVDGRGLDLNIQGIPDVLCGHNTTLENNNTVFTSKQSDIRLAYQWSEFGKTFAGTFKLIFVAFYDGPCQSESGSFSCDNNRCISADITCEDGINSCGNGKGPPCDAPSEDDDSLSQVIQSLPGLAAIVIFVIFVILAKKFIYDKSVRRYGSIRNAPVIRQLFQSNFFQDTHHRPHRHQRTHPQPALSRRSSFPEPAFTGFDDTSSLDSIEFDRLSLSIDDQMARMDARRNRLDTSRILNDRMRNRHEITSHRNGAFSIGNETISNRSETPPPNNTILNRTDTPPPVNTTSNRSETPPQNSTDLPTYDTFMNDTQRFPPTSTDNSNSQPEPTAPPASSDVAPPPSYADVMADNDRYGMR